MALGQSRDISDIEASFRRLGWLSAFTRQALMARHLLRNLSYIEGIQYLSRAQKDKLLLNCVRSIITILSGANPIARTFSSPYEPTNRPQTHFLSFSRKARIFEASIVTGLPSITFYSEGQPSLKLEDIEEASIKNLIFVNEIKDIAKGVGLATKSIADERIYRLRDAELWQRLSPAIHEQDHYNSDADGFWTTDAASFWRRWYQGFLNGNPVDWTLQYRIALIEDATWNAGPEAVADEIARIEADFLAEQAPQAERVEFNAETGKFFTIPSKVAKPDLLGATLSQVQDALDDVLVSPSNGLSDASREARVLRRVFERYGNDPQQIEMGFVSVHKGLTRQIVVAEELPASEENLALMDALEEGARAIRATHPEVDENRKIINQQAIKGLPYGAKETLEEALSMLVAISDEDLANDWQTDIPQLINDATEPLPNAAPPLPGVDETMRICSRAAKISIWMKTADVVHKIDGSAGYKAARIVTTLAAIVTIFIAVLT